MKNNLIDDTSGFTLIELLVVIAVLAFLAVVLTPNFMLARQRARDAQRKSDVSQIQKSLELYRSDQKPPAYPTSLPISLCNQCWSSGAGCTGNIYMNKFPCDPGSLTPTPYSYGYDPSTDALRYNISACLENTVDSDRDPTPMATPPCSASTKSYTLHEP